ncbi:ABC transporter permease [Acidocella aminolytica]|jgi:histidine transport system permease protein|uniref:ABC transporter polar amino acid permease inner membrane subunit n=1 Tax=Acidocella aminolytica 101 = DSM 11237 TaxID=1120923 RepID=A0A0D6PM31_9PROT|nr:ABC transporter permease [Acidocella aminolytica]GAN82283.1 ABC transporter polar amino acid permease inner membrane subunit [Acidocella aminolytica 101 = DSM 11237]GBQ42811.1 arginine ABC transporter permease [Acidocella aminolytica 101 = DSM 11237]SHF65123.1 amino acid ABC transporter membrane protein 1, PAAT family [Acidocella aminolytica 101 = DSM 11237]
MFNLAGYGPQLLAGSVTTVELSVLSLVVSFVLGLIGASAKLSKNRIARALATVYTTLIRGVPDLVLMLLIYYSLQIWINDFTDWLNSLQGHFTFGYNLDPFTSGVITLGFIYGAYFAETFRGAFLAVPTGQMEAARAFGMKPFLAFRRIMFPQMMRYALPGLGNNWQVILKATALVSIIGLSDVVKAAQAAGDATFRNFFFILVAGLVYLVLTIISNGVLFFLERKYMIGVRKAVL